MTIPINQLTNGYIKAAGSITLVDPNEENFSMWIYGQRTVAGCNPRGPGDILEVAVNSSVQAEVLHACDLVRVVKGSLHFAAGD